MNPLDEASPIEDDTQGHAFRHGADAESAEGDEDTAGHRFFGTADAESAEGDGDASGHVAGSKH